MLQPIPPDLTAETARAARAAAGNVCDQQFADATRPDGSIDQNTLSPAVAYSYERMDADSDTQSARFEAVLENMVQGLCFFDGQQRLIVCNRRYAEIYGLQTEHVRPGTTLRDIVDQRYRAGSTPAMTSAEFMRWRDEVVRINRPDDSVMELQNGRVIAIRHQPMPDGGWVATHEDITDRRESERRAAYLARHDAVTGLLNRAALTEQLQDVLNRLSSKTPCAVLSLSLDGLGLVRDTLGRQLGEELLCILSKRLQRCVDPNDLLGRSGTDGFVIVQCEAANPTETTRLADRLLELVSEPIMLEAQKLTLNASIGIALAGAADRQADPLLRNATIALHRAKKDGRGHYRLFEPEMDEMMQARRLLEADLRDAASRMAFEVYYQPQTDLQTQQICGFEALLRWNDPVRGLVSPATFIPLAEEIGLIGPIGKWVLEQACTAAALWPESVTVGVNVSTLQLKDGALSSIVADVLHRSGLAPARLELEITESRMMENGAAAAAMLHQLRSAGVRIAMDDFGTGYSSLSYLPELPFDKIKIDQSFVAGLGKGTAHTAIVRSIISLSANLGVTCTAEGVETEEQLAILTGENCTQAQGYLLGRPCTAKETARLLQAAALRGLDNIGQASVATGAWPAVHPGSLNQRDISFTDIVETANDVIIVTSADLDAPGPTILYVNPAFSRLTGYEPHEAVGRSPRMLQGPGTSRVTLDDIAAGLRAGREVHQKVLNYGKCGTPYWLDLRIVPLRDTAGRIAQFVAIERDVTLDKRRLDELEYIADRDTLTGIPNRRALLRTMDAELQAARLHGGFGPCLAYVDVDHFKRVNDQLGHATGDAVLFGIADRLAENVRRIDMVGRIGGEEFAVCMPSISLREAAEVGERLRRAVEAQPFETPMGPVSVTVSIGVSEACRNENSLADLMERADRALYLAKGLGRNRSATDPALPAFSPVS